MERRWREVHVLKQKVIGLFGMNVTLLFLILESLKPHGINYIMYLKLVILDLIMFVMKNDH